MLWGSSDPLAIDVRFEQVEHNLSHAARVFKARAAEAAGSSAAGSGCHAEAFTSSEARDACPVNTSASFRRLRPLDE